MTSTNTIPMGGGIPRSSNPPSLKIACDRLFMNCKSATVPEISSPTIISLSSAFFSMPNLVDFPRLNVPNCTDMQNCLDRCSSLTGTVPYTTGFPDACNWTAAFQTTRITCVPVSFFKSGGKYYSTFYGCEILSEITPTSSGNDVRYTIHGIDHTSVFKQCRSLQVSDIYTNISELYINFPESNCISEAFNETNLLGSANLFRYILSISAPLASEAHHFCDCKAGASGIQFQMLKIALPSCKAAKDLLGPMTITNEISLNLLTPENSDTDFDPNNLNPMPYLNVGRIHVDLELWKDVQFSQASNANISGPMLDFIRYYVWNTLTLTDLIIPMEIINQIQETAGSRQITFTRCTFTNPTAIRQLNQPYQQTTLICNYCTNTQIVQDCASLLHRVIWS